MAFTGTPAAEAVEAIVRLIFPGRFTRIGQYNRRKISGSSSWSQHSWGNAIDIHVSSGKAVGVERANGDAIAAFLRENQHKFGIRYILWWRANHYDHIHVDMWPKGIYTPPLSSTGEGTFMYSNGATVYKKIQEVPAQGDFSDYEYEEAQVKEVVTFLQETLVAAGFNPGPIDGILGPKTQAALTAALEGGGVADATARSDAAAAYARADTAHMRLDRAKEAI